MSPLKYYLLSLLPVIFYSCTKSDSGNTSTITNPPDLSEKVTGVFLSTISVSDASALLYPNTLAEEATVTFLGSIQDNNTLLADSVWINGLLLRKETTSFGDRHSLNEADVPSLSMRDSTVWRVVDTSHKEIPSFTFRHRIPYPTISGKLPDTVYRSKGFRMNIKVTEADSVVMMIGLDLFNSKFLSKTVQPSLDMYGFSPDELKKVPALGESGSRQDIFIESYKSTIQEIDGRFYKFTKVAGFRGSICILK